MRPLRGSLQAIFFSKTIYGFQRFFVCNTRLREEGRESVDLSFFFGSAAGVISAAVAAHDPCQHRLLSFSDSQSDLCPF
jgi:hypothetical protein